MYEQPLQLLKMHHYYSIVLIILVYVLCFICCTVLYSLCVFSLIVVNINFAPLHYS